jgi:heme A synthase
LAGASIGWCVVMTSDSTPLSLSHLSTTTSLFNMATLPTTQTQAAQVQEKPARGFFGRRNNHTDAQAPIAPAQGYNTKFSLGHWIKWAMHHAD